MLGAPNFLFLLALTYFTYYLCLPSSLCALLSATTSLTSLVLPVPWFIEVGIEPEPFSIADEPAIDGCIDL